MLGTIVLGTLHSLWHLPTGFIAGGPLYPFALTTFVTFVLTGIAGSFLYTWIYNHARGSILIAILIHGAANAAGTLVSLDLPQNPHLSGLAAALYYDRWSNVIAFAGEWIVTLPLVISALLLLTAVSRDVLAIRVLRRTATQTSAVTPSPSPSLT